MAMQQSASIQYVPVGQSPNSPVSTIDSCGINTKTSTTVNTTTPYASSRLQKHRGSARVLKYWRKEAASYVLAFLSLFAVILILIQSNNKPIQHQSGPFTTNSLVSIFTAIFKSAMLMPIAEGLSELKWLWFRDAHSVTDVDRFDLASRGPRGSLQFLFRLPHNKLASMGAFIIVLALGIDPFTQQVIQASDCPWPSSGTAVVSRTNNYTIYGDELLVYKDPAYAIDAQMSAAIYVGMLDPPENSTSSKFYSCSSDVCDFTPNDDFYSSLAMCASVEDITTAIMMTPGNSSTYDQYFLPSGLSIFQPVASYTFAIGSTNRSMSGEDSPYYELEALMFVVTGKTSNESDWAVPWAFRASLYPCIQTFREVRISSRQLEQTVTSTTRLPLINATAQYYSLAGNFSASGGVDCTPATARGGSKTQATHRLFSGKDYVIPHQTGAFMDTTADDHVASSQDIFWYDPACTYEFGAGPTYALNVEFDSRFGRSGFPDGSLYEPKTLYGVSGTATSIGVEHADPWIERIFANGNANTTTVTKYMEGIANAITAKMRTAGDVTNSQPLKGEVMTIRSCVQVKWEWLTLNAVLLISTAAFLMTTIWRARKAVNPGNTMDGRGSWKSSSLPLLWCGLEDSSREHNGLLDELDRMEERSDLLEVKLVKLPGWATVESEVAPDELEQSYAMSHATGRWVLQEQRQLAAPSSQPRLRRWGIQWGKHVPI